MRNGGRCGGHGGVCGVLMFGVVGWCAGREFI